MNKMKIYNVKFNDLPGGGDFLLHLQQSLSPPRYPSSIRRSHYRCFLPDLTGFAE